MDVGLYSTYKKPPATSFEVDGVRYRFIEHEAYRIPSESLYARIEIAHQRDLGFPLVYWGGHLSAFDGRANIGGTWRHPCVHWFSADKGDGSEFIGDVRRDLWTIGVAMLLTRLRSSFKHRVWLHTNVPAIDPQPEHEKEYWRRIKYRLEQIATLRPDMLLIRPCTTEGRGAKASPDVEKALGSLIQSKGS